MMRDMPHNGEKEGRQGRVNIWQSGLEDSKSGGSYSRSYGVDRKRRRLLIAAADDDNASTSPQHIHQIPSPISNVPTEPTVQPTPPPPKASQQTSSQPASQSSPQQSTQSASQHPSTSPQHIVPSVSSPQPSPFNPSNSQTSNKESQRIEFNISIDSQSSPTEVHHNQEPEKEPQGADAAISSVPETTRPDATTTVEQGQPSACTLHLFDAETQQTLTTFINLINTPVEEIILHKLDETLACLSAVVNLSPNPFNPIQLKQLDKIITEWPTLSEMVQTCSKDIQTNKDFLNEAHTISTSLKLNQQTSAAIL
ncbi:hypothetical protein CsSME_00001109 [Camellia sinensis var. sinensis]